MLVVEQQHNGSMDEASTAAAISHIEDFVGIQTRVREDALKALEREGALTDTRMKQLGEWVWRKQFRDVQTFAMLSTDATKRFCSEFAELESKVRTVMNSLQKRICEAEDGMLKFSELTKAAETARDWWLQRIQCSAIVLLTCVAIAMVVALSSFASWFCLVGKHQNDSVTLAQQTAHMAACAPLGNRNLDLLLLGSIRHIQCGHLRKRALRPASPRWSMVKRESGRVSAEYKWLEDLFIRTNRPPRHVLHVVFWRVITWCMEQLLPSLLGRAEATVSAVQAAHSCHQRSGRAMLYVLLLLVVAVIGCLVRYVLERVAPLRFEKEIASCQRQYGGFKAAKHRWDEELSKFDIFVSSIVHTKELITPVHDAAHQLAFSAGNAIFLDSLLPSEATEAERAVTGEALRKEVFQMHSLHQSLSSSTQRLYEALRHSPSTAAEQHNVAEQLVDVRGASPPPSFSVQDPPPLAQWLHRRGSAPVSASHHGQYQGMRPPSEGVAAISVASYPSVSQIATEPPGTHPQCLPDDALLCIPVAEVARLGGVTVCGPGGSRFVTVAPQGARQRMMSTFGVADDAKHTLTSDHRLQVLRNDVWIVEQASALQLGDGVIVANGVNFVSRVQEAPEQRKCNVYEIHVQSLPSDHRPGAQVYVHQPRRSDDGTVCLSTLAVLGASHHEKEAPLEKRPTSAPPRLTELRNRDLPSRGSAKHASDGSRCKFICRHFHRTGSCEKGRNCDFCHFEHPEAPKRAFRGRAAKAATAAASAAKQPAGDDSESG